MYEDSLRRIGAKKLIGHSTVFGRQSLSQPTEYGKMISQSLLTLGAEFPTPPVLYSKSEYFSYNSRYTEDNSDTEFDEKSDEEDSDGLDEQEYWSDKERDAAGRTLAEEERKAAHGAEDPQ
jgi:hypothetical protein